MKNITKFKFRLWLVLSLIGLIGVASLLLSDLPLDNIPEQIRNSVSPETLKLLVLINPAFLVMLLTLIGTIFYNKVNLKVPIFEKLLNKPESESYSLAEIIKQGIFFGILAGILIVLAGKIFEPYLPQALTEATSDLNLHIATKVLYGGIAEELLTRFGLMSLFVWILFKITKKLNTTIYWIGIGLAAILFALGHLPIVFQVVSEPTLPIYAYILIGNSIGGIIFGYMYWKKGLESAFIAHSFAHFTMITAGLILK